MALDLSPNVFFRCVEDSNEAIMLTDKNGILRYVNPMWCKVYGYSNKEAIGSKPSLLHSGKHSDSFYREMWGQIQDPNIGHWKGELFNRTKNGQLVQVLLTIAPYKGADDSISGYMGIAVDITESKCIERHLQEEDRLSSIGLLASGLAHEIGTPMTVIRGRAELLSMAASPDSGLSKGLKIIVEQIDRISGLMQSLLNLARSPEKQTLCAVPMLPIIHSVLDLIAVQLRHSNVVTAVACDPGLCAHGNPNSLTQVLLNLCVNAIHALDDCNKDKVIKTTDWQPRIWIRACLVENSRVQICIEDNGPGISSENLVKIFKPFFTTKDADKGTGLGLAVAAKIIAEMGGHIEVETTEKLGTQFKVTIHSA